MSFDEREQAAYERLVALMRSVDPGVPVGDGSWTARDVLAHLCNVARRYTSVPRLGETVREVDTINAEELTALDGLSVQELLGKFERAFARYREVWVGMGPEHMWPFHGGGQIGTTSLRTNWLAEMLVHGYDVAAAAGLGWPISSEDAADVLAFLREVLPAYGLAGAPLTIEVAGDGAQAWLLVIDGEGARAADPGAADAALRGPGSAIVLFLYQRLDLAGAETRGLQVEGDRGAVARLTQQLQRP